MKFLLAAVLSVSLSSCVGLYTPNRPPTPLLHHVNEINVSVGGSTFGFEAQAAYAMTNHIGFIGAMDYSPSFGVGAQASFVGNFLELGAGYFDSAGEVGHLEAYGTLGFGKAYGNITTAGQFAFGSQTQGGPGYTQPPFGYNRFIDSKFFRQTLQANMGIEGKVAAVGIGLRESLVDMFQWHQFDQAMNAGDSNIDVRGSKAGLFFEPLFFARVGYRWVKVYLEYWLTLPVTRYSDTWTPFNASFGLSFDF